MSEPILVLNRGSSSIKFALFDPGLDPLPRVPMRSGRLEGIGSSSARLVERDTRRSARRIRPQTLLAAEASDARERAAPSHALNLVRPA